MTSNLRNLLDETRKLLRQMRDDVLQGGALTGRSQRAGEDLIHRIDDALATHETAAPHAPNCPATLFANANDPTACTCGQRAPDDLVSRLDATDARDTPNLANDLMREASVEIDSLRKRPALPDEIELHIFPSAEGDHRYVRLSAYDSLRVECDRYRAALESICNSGRNPIAEKALGL